MTDPLHANTSLRIVDDVAKLEAIFEPVVNVVCLRRALPLALAAECRQLVSKPGFRKLFTVRCSPPELRDIQDAIGPLRHLTNDVHFWADVLSELAGSAQIGVRLARVDSAMCPRFHVDRVPLRLVCTYEGPGTEYAGSEHVDRRRLGHAAGSDSDEASGLLLSPDCVRAAEPGDIVLLKGEAWPETRGRGAVHRSPAASSRSPRLVMTLDPL
jgi:Protein of unknown function (DUF1826)